MPLNLLRNFSQLFNVLKLINQMRIMLINNNFEIKLFFFYLLCHGGIFFILNSIYWDDWMLFNMEPHIYKEMFSQAGGQLFNLGGYLHELLLTFGPWSYRVLTFFLMFISALLLNNIIKKINWIDDEVRKIVVIFFLILPFNSARVTLICFPYTLSYCLFFLAWSLKTYRIFALPVFFISFLTNSLLVFYGLVLLDLYFKDNKLIDFRSIMVFIKQKFEYIILPFLYFGLKIFYWVPHGNFVGYHQNFAIQNLFLAPFFQFIDLFNLRINLLIFISVFIFFMLLNPFKYFNDQRFSKVNFLYVGIISLFLGLFPYWILNYSPTFQEWSNRHQLLMPLGTSFLMCFIIKVSSGVLQKVYFYSILTLSLIINMNNYINFYIDWNKQTEIFSELSKNRSLSEYKLIFIDDRTTNYNALSRVYRSNEWNGIFKFVYKNENRYILNISDVDWYKKNYDFSNTDLRFGSATNFKGNIALQDAVLLTINLVPSNSLTQTFLFKFKPKFNLILDNKFKFN
jgi:hypothetical protein